MVEWEKLSSVTNEDDLKELKIWLFQENVRLQNERRELEERRERFIKERVQFRDEMNSLNRRMVMERKRLKDENLFFDKKMQILQDGFRQLEMDRRKFEKDKRLYESQQNTRQERTDGYGNRESGYSFGKGTQIAEILFSGVNNVLELKKRYRDLIKIFHPDNLCGDAWVVQMINQEYERKRRE